LDKGYIKIYSTHKAFAAIKANGSIASWGSLDNSWNEIKNKTTNAPTDKGYTKIYSNEYAFAALKADGSTLSVGMFLRVFFMLPHGFSMSPHVVIEPSAFLENLPHNPVYIHTASTLLLAMQ
jgi:hypothetical protein